MPGPFFFSIPQKQSLPNTSLSGNLSNKLRQKKEMFDNNFDN